MGYRLSFKITNIILLSGMLALTGCTWTQVQVTTTVVKVGVDVDKEGSPDIRNWKGELDIVPDILRALPETDADADAYWKGTGDDQ